MHSSRAACDIYNIASISVPGVTSPLRYWSKIDVFIVCQGNPKTSMDKSNKTMQSIQRTERVCMSYSVVSQEDKATR